MFIYPSKNDIIVQTLSPKDEEMLEKTTNYRSKMELGENRKDFQELTEYFSELFGIPKDDYYYSSGNFFKEFGCKNLFILFSNKNILKNGNEAIYIDFDLKKNVVDISYFYRQFGLTKDKIFDVKEAGQEKHKKLQKYLKVKTSSISETCTYYSVDCLNPLSEEKKIKLVEDFQEKMKKIGMKNEELQERSIRVKKEFSNKELDRIVYAHKLEIVSNEEIDVELIIKKLEAANE